MRSFRAILATEHVTVPPPTVAKPAPQPAERITGCMGVHLLGKHDQDNTKDGQWPKPVPKDDIRDDPKDDGGKHGSGSDQDKDQDKK